MQLILFRKNLILQDRNKQIHHKPESLLYAQLLRNYSNTMIRITMHFKMKLFPKNS
jgi:hypothetical protein